MKPNDLSFLLNSSNLSPVASKDTRSSVNNPVTTLKRKSISIESLLETPRKLQKVNDNEARSPLPSQAPPTFPLQYHHPSPPHHQQYTTQPIPLPSPKLHLNDLFNESDHFLQNRSSQQPPSPLSLSSILASPPPHSPVLPIQPVVSVSLSATAVPAPATKPVLPQSTTTTKAQELSPKSTPSSLTLKIASALRTRLTYAKIKLQNGWESKSLSRIESMNKNNNSNCNNNFNFIYSRLGGNEFYDLDPLRINDSVANSPAIDPFRRSHRSSQSISDPPVYAPQLLRINSEPDIITNP